MARYIKGQQGELAVYDTDAYKPVVCLESYTVNESRGEVSGRTFCDANGAVQKEAGEYSSELTFNGLVGETETGKLAWQELKEYIRTLADNKDIRLTTTYSDDSTLVEYCNGFISSLEKTGEKDNFITFSGTIMVSGLINNTDPNA